MTSHSQGSYRTLWAVIVSEFLLLLALAASNQGLKHFDVKYKVDTAMIQNNLGVVKVSQYQDKA